MLVTNEIAEVYFRLLGTNGFHVKAEDKNLPLRACVVVRTSSMKISRRHLADYVKKLHKKSVPHMRTIICSIQPIKSLVCVVVVVFARAARLCFLIRPIGSLICGVVVAIAVVVSIQTRNN